MSRSLTMPLLSVAALLLTGCAAGAQEDPPADQSSAATTAASPTSTAPVSPRMEALAALDTAPEAAEGFDPAAFGPELTAEVDEGCSTYKKALFAYLEEPTVQSSGKNPCLIMSGTIVDPTNGITYGYVPAEDSGQYVDRWVSLEDAWASGADQWTDEQRRAFANDVETLYAASETTVTQRAGADAAGWLPEESPCSFIDSQMQVKADYELAVDDAEREALEQALAGCS